MALVGLLIALIIMMLLFFFTFVPSNKQTVNQQHIENNAQEVVNKAVEQSKIEQGSIKNLDH